PLLDLHSLPTRRSSDLGTTNHWGALAFRMQAHELRARATYGAVAGTELADWPIAFEELEYYWSLAESKMGVTGTHGIPLLPVTKDRKSTRLNSSHVKIS